MGGLRERLVELLPALVDQLPVVVLVLDREGRTVYANPPAEQLCGRSLADFEGEDWLATFVRDGERERIRNLFADCLAGTPVCGTVSLLVTATGEQRTIEWHARPLRDEHGEVVGAVWSGRNVTGVAAAACNLCTRQGPEAALAHTQEQLLRAEHLARLGSWSWTPSNGQLSWSPEMYRIAGVDPSEMPDPTFEKTAARVYLEDLEAALVWARSMQQVGTSAPLELRVWQSDGELRVIRAEGERVGDDQVIGFAQDVTEQRRSAEELHTHSQVLMSMSEGVLFLDREGTIRFTNPALDDMFGYAAGELVGQHVRVLNRATMAENAEIEAHLMDELALHGRWEGELPSRRKDGSTFPSWVRITPLPRPGEVMWVSIQRDITEQRRYEAQLRTSVKEKDTLLREVHHRVKNNLQIISSLLHFQAKKVRDRADLAAFDDGRKRLLAMILVHDQLYQADQLSRIDFADYVRSLVGALVASFESAPRIDFVVAAQSVTVPVGVALPAGMILCELVTNIFKYAFPGADRGDAAVTVAEERGRVTITVNDAGIGFPTGFDAESTATFGWQLIRMLAAQIDGRVTATTDDGARVVVEFPVPLDSHPVSPGM